MIYDKYAFDVPESKIVRVIVDTDAKNEADDQYAIVQALLSPRFDVRGIVAAHFGTQKCEHSMEASYDEIVHVLNLMRMDTALAYRGAERALTCETVPRPSAGARLIVEEAMKNDERPLYILFMGPLTDMASAYLMEPRIAGRCTCVWIGGGRYPAGGPEYNLSNDIHAANCVFKSNLEVWQIPNNVYKKVTVSIAELEYKVRPLGELGKYLFEQLVEHGHLPVALATYRTGECWCLGDSPAVGVLLSHQTFDYDWTPAPEFGSNMEYIHHHLNRPIRVFNYVDSRFILEDFFAKLAMFTRNNDARASD